MAYPGSDSCIPIPDCDPNYDSEAISTSCVNGVRKISYRWRTEVICNSDRVSLPATKQIGCAICGPGYSFRDSLSGICEPCSLGYFTDADNMTGCFQCLAGKYAPRVERYENLESWPIGLSTKCETVAGEHIDWCAFTKGWIITRNTITVPPNLPAETRVTINKTFNATQDFNTLQFVYTGYESTKDNPGIFQIKIDGVITSIIKNIYRFIALPLSPNQTKNTYTFTSGIHFVEWIYEKLTNLQEKNPVKIISIRIPSQLGSADECIQCPDV